MSRKQELNAKYRSFRKEHGICQRCMNDAVISDKTGLPESLCLKHKQENLAYWKKRRLSMDRKVLLAKQKEWNKNRKISMKCHRFVKSILTALKEPISDTEYTEDFRPFIRKENK